MNRGVVWGSGQYVDIPFTRVGGAHFRSHGSCRCQKYRSRVTVKLSVTRSGNRVEFMCMRGNNLKRFKNKLRERTKLSVLHRRVP